MRRARRIASPFVCPFLLFLITGCATGNRLVITGEPARPEAAAKVPAGDAPVAVLDFEYAALEPGVVGRDFDHVRPIVWEGKPGKVMADLVAGVLAGHGVRAVRAAAEGPALDNVPVRVSGRVRRFEVNARRIGGWSVVTEATVSVAFAVEGGSLPGLRESTVTSTTSLKDVFVTPDDARNALFSSANAAAEEVGRRLLEAVGIPPPTSGR